MEYSKRAIDCQTAAGENVEVGNLPGINSPFVARHQVQWLNLKDAKPNSKIAIIGVGNIGKNIAFKALEFGLDVHLFSPSLQNPSSRSRTLAERSLPADRVTCSPSLEAAFAGAEYVAISVPWLNPTGKPHAGLITQAHLETLQTQAQLSSASPPRIFSNSALEWLNEHAQQGAVQVRIDTAKRLAEEVGQAYPNIGLGYNVAFAARDCQQALDRAMLEQARRFMKT